MTDGPATGLGRLQDTRLAEGIIRKRALDLPEANVRGLAVIWSEVVHRIMQTLMAKDYGGAPLHVNVKAEMSLELSKLLLFLTEKVIEKRIGGRSLADIDPDAEQLACLTGAGLQAIEATANSFEGHWRERMTVRWEPKSKKALDREADPPSPRPLPVKPVRDKHFISRWFIRDYWSAAGMTTRWRRTDSGWRSRCIPFGQWGHREGLWDDRVEAGFSLVEGDGKRPIEMLLAMEPLNPPQQAAFISFLVIHMLRDPAFVMELRHHLHDMMDDAAKNAGMSFEDMARAAYATLFDRNDLYHHWSSPLVSSRWAIVSAEEPVFVLPDTFCARVGFEGSYRTIVPLTPTRCFVTLCEHEAEKSVVPSPVKADAELAHQISGVLVKAARSEFLAHGDFSFDQATEGTDLLDVIRAIERRDRRSDG